jgi:four helix bundle protein
MQIIDCRLFIADWLPTSGIERFRPELTRRRCGINRAPRIVVNQQAEALKKRTKKFALDILTFVRTLPATEEAKVVGRQLIRSATGVGANYRATCRSRSRAEFIARIGVALEEADESAFWLEVITEAGMVKARRAFELLDEADQLSAILAASSITATGTPPRSKSEI